MYVLSTPPLSPLLLPMTTSLVGRESSHSSPWQFLLHRAGTAARCAMSKGQRLCREVAESHPSLRSPRWRDTTTRPAEGEGAPPEKPHGPADSGSNAHRKGMACRSWPPGSLPRLRACHVETETQGARIQRAEHLRSGQHPLATAHHKLLYTGTLSTKQRSLVAANSREKPHMGEKKTINRKQGASTDPAPKSPPTDRVTQRVPRRHPPK